MGVNIQIFAGTVEPRAVILAHARADIDGIHIIYMPYGHLF